MRSTEFGRVLDELIAKRMISPSYSLRARVTDLAEDGDLDALADELGLAEEEMMRLALAYTFDEHPEGG
jgi:hypothetical protein